MRNLKNIKSTIDFIKQHPQLFYQRIYWSKRRPSGQIVYCFGGVAFELATRAKEVDFSTLHRPGHKQRTVMNFLGLTDKEFTYCFKSHRTLKEIKSYLHVD